MPPDQSEIRSKFLELIESENLLADRFRDIRRIDQKGGDGYFSLMFFAKDIKSGEEVALKFFDPLKTHQVDRLKRFQREAEMLHLLADEPYVIDGFSPGINILHKLMEDTVTKIKLPLQLQYIAMKKADINVESFIDKNDPPPINMIELFKEMYKAVTRIHDCRICHRDLKPTNFLISKGRVFLSDFGTAKCMDHSMPDIQEIYTKPVGDLRYIAPELFLSIGIGDEFVYRSDIFSLGAILFEMFTNTILTSQIYDQNTVSKLTEMQQVLSRMKPEARITTFLSIVDEFARTILLPDIFSYNQKVPGSIKNHLNELYKSLSNINFIKRVTDIPYVHRKLDICIKILKNEDRYQRWIKEKLKRRENRMNKNTRKH